ncbi:hypothetical protein AVO45_10860 [Ruegeria marisrubri]|uniref:Metal-binding protein n=1 Tax=Ruegeria marisrubri TaxID=1685379 RepID=A0A0X3TMH6_9RHOB|nr:DUF2182 domain-containing protein [Ruegeria marisrubri]KUJ76977.1 hypothetical protein AVO45_10860 [Ruegeria marisrubri]
MASSARENTGAPPGPSVPGPVEHLLRHDRWIVLGSVTLIVVGAAWYTIAGVGMNMSAIEMTRMARPVGKPMEMGGAAAWSLRYGVLVFLMWWVMMIAMMTPSAAPTLLLYAAIKRMGPDRARARQLGMFFLSGYLLIWALFSLVATLLQWGLENTGHVNGPMMTIRSQWFAGAVLIAAGVYQFSPLKRVCLHHCRSPAHFLSAHGRPGRWGALRTGAHHGSYCLGCCWALMALLFVGGIMNLYWIVGIALYVAAEKLLPRARWFVPLTGAALVCFGTYLISTSVFAAA